ncbi:hypothetical protein [Croceicoccus mobilis]|uniref:Uncharacterized protein n=1 Tax=Croceicoccus mobilis TaxID=1703339 RepID=A0A916YTC7_9SPHN|nr:hypothetical protein [Croceicoccus mobilis]GGD59656.1 hypothetical protein GCM10010990_06300 [Croceicoccus mobilis]
MAQSANPAFAQRRALPARKAGAERSSALAVNGIVWVFFLALILTNLVFPKGGTFIYGLPITWGYLAICAAAPLGLIGLVRRSDISLAPLVQALCFFLPIALLIFYKAKMYSLPGSEWLPLAVLFGVFPVAILGIMTPYLEQIRAQDIARAVRLGIRFLLIWGLMNFVLFIIARKFIEIPYITVNGQEVGMTLGKNNLRGSLMKFVSTYNNGNIFGTCMVMLAPIYFHFEKKKLWLGLFIVAVLCTLSRSAWFGLAATLMLMGIMGQIRINRLRVWLLAGFAFCILIAVLPLLGWSGLDDVFDTQLGGRIRYLVKLELNFTGAEQIAIPEILYFGLLYSFGMIGFLIAMGGFLYGIFYGAMRWTILSPMRRAAVLGAVGYLIMAAMDGAFLFPPVFPLFLFVNALIYRRGLRETTAGLARNASSVARMRRRPPSPAYPA